MLTLKVNGEPETLPDASSVADFLAARGYERPAVAVAINGTFVPRSQYEQVHLQAGQYVEILSPMQGG